MAATKTATRPGGREKGYPKDKKPDREVLNNST
jgi:hypothetical protein